MGTIRKVGDDYYIEFEARGLKYQQKAGPSETAAWKLLEEVEGKIRQGQMGIMVRDVDADIFFEDFLKEVAAKQPPRTRERLRATVEHFSSFLRRRNPIIVKLSEVTPKIIEEYKASLRSRAHLINFTILLLKEILDYAIKLGYLNDNPVLHVRWIQVRSMFTQPVSMGEAENVIKQYPSSCAMLEIILETGLRWQEVQGLRWEDVDLNQKILRVKGREIPLSSRAVDIIRLQEQVRARENPVFLPAEEIPFRLAIRLRHAFAGGILQKRISLLKFCQIMGISDMARVMRYFPWDQNCR